MLQYRSRGVANWRRCSFWTTKVFWRRRLITRLSKRSSICRCWLGRLIANLILEIEVNSFFHKRASRVSNREGSERDLALSPTNRSQSRSDHSRRLRIDPSHEVIAGALFERKGSAHKIKVIALITTRSHARWDQFELNEQILIQKIALNS